MLLKQINLLSDIKILDFDSKASESYGKIKAYLECEGIPICSMDI